MKPRFAEIVVLTNHWNTAKFPGWGAKQFSILAFIQQKLISLSIACNIKLECALCSVFHVEASKRPGTSLNE